MFETVVEKLVKAIGLDVFKPSPSIGASDNLELLSLVERKASRWWLGNNSYYTTEFALSNVTQGEEELKVKIDAEKDLSGFNKNITVKVNGSMSGHFKSIFSAELSDVESITVKADLGELHLVEVNEQCLLDSLCNRRLNMSHELLRELAAKNRRALCIVTGVVKTTIPTTITAKLNLKLSAKEKLTAAVTCIGGESAEGDYEKDRAGTLNMPAGTVLAYQVVELLISDTGAVRVMVSHNAVGGFHSKDVEDVVDRAPVVQQLCTSVAPGIASYNAVGGLPVMDVEDEVDSVPAVQQDFIQKEFEGLTLISAESRKALVEQLLQICARLDDLRELRLLLAFPEATSQNERVQKMLLLMSNDREDAATVSLQKLCRALNNLDVEALSHLSAVRPSELSTLLGVTEVTYSGSCLSFYDELLQKLICECRSSFHFIIVGLGYVLDADGLKPFPTKSQRMLNSAYAAVYALNMCYNN